MRRQVVVGGGLSGSLLAIFLARRGYEVDVFERHPDARAEARKRRPALNITLCERGLKALEAVGLREAVLRISVPARGRRIHGSDGSVAYQPYGNRGEAIYSVSRAALNQTLVDFAGKEPGVRFHFDQKCVGVDLQREVVRFEHGTTGKSSEVAADRIFGADGAYSAVRFQMQKIDRFDYSQQYWGFGGYKSLWVPAPADGGPALAGEALHIWPRGSRMLIGFPNRDGSAMLSLLLPFRGGDSYESLSTEANLQSFFRSSFPDVVEEIPALAEQFFATPANSLVTVRCAPWSRDGKVLLLGDAAHAILPSYGQGANAAFEDCSVLDHCMAQHGEDWTAVFQSFEASRKPHLDVMAELCIEHFAELCDLVADPGFLKRREVERRLNDLYPDLYRPLYSMVSFSCVPYAEAFEIEQAQRATVDRIIAFAGVDGRLDTPEVQRLLEEPVREPAPPASLESTAEEDDSQSVFGIAMGFWGAKALLSAVELGLFAELARGPRSSETLASALGMHSRGATDFLDALTALGLLSRADHLYANTARAERLLVPGSPSYIGGAMELANARLYPVWAKLTEALRTGLPQNEAKAEQDYYGNLARDPERLRSFLRGMTGLSMMASKAIARKFPWRNYKTFADLGGAQGVLPVQLATSHEHLEGINFDLPPVRPVFDEYTESVGLSQRIRFHAGDFFVDPLPPADVYILGHVLHNWDLEQKRTLIKKTYDALPRGGVLIVYEALIDDARESRAFGLLMSLNMLLVTSGGFVFTGSECQSWMHGAGFSRTYVEHLDGPDWMVVGIK